MAEPVLSAELTVERWERGNGRGGEVRLSTGRFILMGTPRVIVDIDGLSTALLRVLADDRTRYRFTLTPVEEGIGPTD